MSAETSPQSLEHLDYRRIFILVKISPVTIYHACDGTHTGDYAPSEGFEVFLSEVIWREFSYELIDQFPDMPDQPLRPEFRNFPGQRTIRLILKLGRKVKRVIRSLMLVCGSFMKQGGCIIASV